MIVFLHGDNDYAVSRHISQLQAQYQKKYADALESLTIDAGEAGFAELEQNLLAVPMFFSHRLVVVTNLTATKAYDEKFLSLVDRIPETTVAVLDGRGLDRRLSFFKALAKLPGSKEYKALSPAELSRWLQQEVKRQGGSLSASEAVHLIARAGNDQWRLSQEAYKLADPDQAISKARIDNLVAPRLEDSVFKLTGAIARRDTTGALRLYDELMLRGSSEPAIIGALSWQFRVYALALDEASPDDIKAAGMNPYAVQRAHSEVRNLDKRLVARAYQLLLQADQAIKRGELKPNLAMLQLIVELTD